MLLSGFSLYVVTMPIIVKLISWGVLIFYSYLLSTAVSVRHFFYLGKDQFECHISNGRVYVATLANDSIFMSWFILMRFCVTGHHRSYSVILFRGSEKFTAAQRIKQQVLFSE